MNKESFIKACKEARFQSDAEREAAAEFVPDDDEPLTEKETATLKAWNKQMQARYEK